MDLLPNQLDLFNRPIPEVLSDLNFNQGMALFVLIHWSRTKMASRTTALIELIVGCFDGRPLFTIGRQDVANMRRRLAALGYGTAYINKAHMIVKLLFNKLFEWQADGWAEGYDFRPIKLPARNPAELVPIPKDPARDRFIQPNEFRRLIRFAKQLNDWDMVDTLRMALWCRLSPIDLQELNDREINEESWQIELRRRHTITPRTPEGCVQIIPLREKIWGLIERRRKVRPALERRILNFGNFKRRFNRLRKLAVANGVRPFQLRDFRRSGSGFLWERGVDPVTVSEGMGHTSIKVWEHHYKPKTRPHLRRSTEILVDAFDE